MDVAVLPLATHAHKTQKGGRGNGKHADSYDYDSDDDRKVRRLLRLLALYVDDREAELMCSLLIRTHLRKQTQGHDWDYDSYDSDYGYDEKVKDLTCFDSL